MSTKHRAIHWFRKGLRLHDNPAFIEACKEAVEVYPIFCLDPWFCSSSHIGSNRWRFLLQSLQDLDKSLQMLDLRLFVIKGKPDEEMERFCKTRKITRLTFEVDTEPYAIRRDEMIEQRMKLLGVEVVKCVSHTLYDVSRTVQANGGSSPLTYQRLQTVLSKLGPPKKPLSSPTKESLIACRTPISDDHDKKFGVPTMEDLNKDVKQCGPLLFQGGETEAMDRMERYLKKSHWICTFEKPKTSPNSLSPSTTVLSPYLKFGCLSPRLFYHRLVQVYKGNKHTQPPVSLVGQLLWREFFYTVAWATPNFDRMQGNPICRQIPWGTNPQHLEKWTHGQTGFPFIDAIMRQLRQEGWIHHLARHAVACFLTRGDLWLSWEEGMKVFDELLLDADWSLNAGNWMWLSASAFFHQYFRVYSPIAFGKKTDSNGDFIRKYVPELKKYPSKYIFEPWTAPSSVQKAAGCLIGQQYPKPIVEHDIARTDNIKKMAAAYAASKANSAGKNGSGDKKDSKSTHNLKRKKMDDPGKVQPKIKFKK